MSDDDPVMSGLGDSLTQSGLDAGLVVGWEVEGQTHARLGMSEDESGVIGLGHSLTQAGLDACLVVGV